MRHNVKSMKEFDDLFDDFKNSKMVSVKNPSLTLTQLSKLRPLRYPPVKWEGIADCSFSDEENKNDFQAEMIRATMSKRLILRKRPASQLPQVNFTIPDHVVYETNPYETLPHEFKEPIKISLETCYKR